MTDKINPLDFLEILKGADIALNCVGFSCFKCPIAIMEPGEKFIGCLAVKVKELSNSIPEKCPTCGAVKNG